MKKQRRTRQRGKNITNVQSISNPQTSKRSSSGQRTQLDNVNREESNDTCARGDGGEKPSHVNIK